MELLPIEVIEDIPPEVQADQASIAAACDAALFALFLMGTELEAEERPAYPPLLSGSVEVWPLPAPWLYEAPTDEAGLYDTEELLAYVNGGPATEHRGAQPGLLKHVRRNAFAYNQALLTNAQPEAVRIATQGAQDSALVWNNLNALAQSLEGQEVYRPIELTEPTIDAYYALSESTT